VAGCGSVALALPQAAPANSSGVEPPIAIIHVTVIDTRTGGEARDRTVVISDGRILSVRDSKKSRVPRRAKEVDASGKFLIPGLWDMHVHETRNFDTLPLYIANG
jgi:imidazolonepropionase-like amidohydrolase